MERCRPSPRYIEAAESRQRERIVRLLEDVVMPRLRPGLAVLAVDAAVEAIRNHEDERL